MHHYNSRVDVVYMMRVTGAYNEPRQTNHGEGTDFKFPRTGPDEQEKRDGRHQDRKDEVQEVGW